MVTFAYQDFCKYRKYLSSNLRESSTPYSYNTIRDVHDKLYRDFLNDKSEFCKFLNDFFYFNITPDDLINYNNAFVSEDYKNRRSDIVYKIKNEPVYIFLEHQSSIDHSINYRILEYYYFILRQTVDFRKIKNKNYKFPIIIPILLYTGTERWDFTPNFSSKQANSSIHSFNIHKLDFEYEFVDLHDYSLNQLLNMNTMLSYALAIDKCKNEDEFLVVLKSLCNNITPDIRKDHLSMLITYGFNDFINEDMRKKLLKKLKEGSVNDMKLGIEYVWEDIRRKEQEAIAAGRQEGLEEGQKNGFLNGVRNFIKAMLENGESVEKAKKYSGLSSKEFDKILKELNLSV